MELQWNVFYTREEASLCAEHFNAMWFDDAGDKEDHENAYEYYIIEIEPGVKGVHDDDYAYYIKEGVTK